jgi:SAM-dependent methyltransferase
MGWREYWNSDNPIYVNARHKHVHGEIVADAVIRMMDGQRLCVLDFGCGEALFADRVADRSKQLFLCDGAETIRRRLMARFAARSDVRILAPEDMDATIEQRSIDLAVVNSVVQYLDQREFRALLASLKTRLAPGGRLVIGDVIPPDQSPAADAMALLSLAARNGFFVAAVTGLVRTVFSGYLLKRAELGLTRYSEGDMLDVLRDAGFTARRAHPNIGHNQGRMLFVATPADVSAAAQP